jgi:hypothetical protein
MRIRFWFKMGYGRRAGGLCGRRIAFSTRSIIQWKVAVRFAIVTNHFRKRFHCVSGPRRERSVRV